MRELAKTALWILALLALPALTQAGQFLPANTDGIEGEYLVMLENRPDKQGVTDYRGHIGEIAAGYGGSLQGLGCSESLGIFTVRMTEEQARRLAGDPRIRVVEQNRRVTPDFAQPLLGGGGEEPCDPFVPSSPGGSGSLCGPNPDIDCDVLDPRDANYDCNDNWGLDRIDQQILPRDCSYSPLRDGAGVHVYVLDTGIQAAHTDFTGRIGAGVNTTPGNDGNLDDCLRNGHGTHVSGIIGGTRFGVAKGVTFHPVKWYGECEGDGSPASTETICLGIDWIYDNHGTTITGPGVVNFSGGNDSNTAESEILRNAIRALIDDRDVAFVQSAGNHEADTCDESFAGPGLPGQAQLPEVIVVGGADVAAPGGQEVTGRWRREGASTTGNAEDPSYDLYCDTGPPNVPDCGSNDGSCVDIWAPGAHIVSASHDEPSGGGCRQSGTSMAAPQVTGAVALYLQKHPDATPAVVKEAILAAGEPTVLDADPQSDYFIGSGSPNLLARVGTILNDDFETGDISRWDGSWTPNPGTLEVAVGPSPSTLGLVITPVASGDPYLFVSDESAFEEKEFGLTFNLDLRGFSLGSSSISLLSLRGEQGANVGILRMRLVSGVGYQLRLGAWDDDGTFKQVPTTGWATIGPSLTFSSVRIAWAAAANPSSSDGYLAMWINGQQAGKRTDLENDGKDVGTVWFGMTGGSLSGVSGSYHLDTFRSFEGLIP